jgi:hypothetical protein
MDTSRIDSNFLMTSDTADSMSYYGMGVQTLPSYRVTVTEYFTGGAHPRVTLQNIPQGVGAGWLAIPYGTTVTGAHSGILIEDRQVVFQTSGGGLTTDETCEWSFIYYR